MFVAWSDERSLVDEGCNADTVCHTCCIHITATAHYVLLCAHSNINMGLLYYNNLGEIHDTESLQKPKAQKRRNDLFVQDQIGIHLFMADLVRSTENVVHHTTGWNDSCEERDFHSHTPAMHVHTTHLFILFLHDCLSQCLNASQTSVRQKRAVLGDHVGVIKHYASNIGK